jgi:hypothetical protein
MVEASTGTTKINDQDMKTVQVFTIFFLFVFLLGCKSSSMALRSNSDAVEGNSDRPSTKGTRGGAGGSETTDDGGNARGDSGSVSADAAQYNGSTGGNDVILATEESDREPTDYTEMYTATGMTQDQIMELETAMKRFMKSATTRPNGEMMGTLESERERQLKTILSPQQFKKYAEWKENRDQENK